MAVDLAIKACTSCAEFKPASEFHLNYGKPRPSCKACGIVAASDWIRKNREKRRAAQRSRYHKRKDDAEFMERKRARGRESAARVRQDPLHKEKRRQKEKAYRQKDVIPYLVRGARSRAKNKGIEFNLTVEWARESWTGRCEITGIEFVQGAGSQGSRSPSIDRIDPMQGYTQKNCRFILSAVNSFKGSGSDEEMHLIACALVGVKWQ